MLTPETGRSWADKQKAQKYLTFDVDESLRKASPYGANYVNEVSSTFFSFEFSASLS